MVGEDLLQISLTGLSERPLLHTSPLFAKSIDFAKSQDFFAKSPTLRNSRICSPNPGLYEISGFVRRRVVLAQRSIKV